ncbi:hypothetical protein Hbl1158_13470 [Halobaculum sp. CBA1158]|uniref:hypothetical protein n=1 Tax=Halobaculum sp. CBA1158 TaxID=2904243 RepID=UPI001F310B24|nr:hypothetical protein [Halobaculum sp. CBA1158]UIO99517.1 hypothetical protein Hbl1158_13470 [Halobaculum sp. CBA1158]
MAGDGPEEDGKNPDGGRAGSDPDYDPETRGTGHPIDSNALLVAAAKASVGPGRLPELLRAADDHLRERAGEYERTYERVDDATDGESGEAAATYLVPEGHWAEIGDALELNRREADALRRAHEQHLLRVGTRRRRRREFESALELREAVVIEE